MTEDNARAAISTGIAQVPAEPTRRERRVLNVGGNSKAIPIPPHYNGWTHHLLDIDPRGAPDVLCDARELASHTAESYDAIYCSHNLEHYFTHDVPRVLKGFLHVLRPDGFAEIRVPDIGALIRTVVARNLELDDVIYVSKAGPILVRDVIYGYGREIEASGQDFYAHKTGFSPAVLRKALATAGFRQLMFANGELEVRVIAFKTAPTDYHRTLFKMPGSVVVT